MAGLGETSPTEPRKSIEEQVLDLSVEARTTLVRGLTRTRMIGRHENGLPITLEGEMMGEVLRQNRVRIEQEEE